VVYIPSGLYRIHVPGQKAVYSHPPRRSTSWWLRDRGGALLSRFARSKSRVQIAIMLLVLGIGLILGLNYLRSQSEKASNAPTQLTLYYNKVLDIDKSLKQAELEYDRGVGGVAGPNDYADRTSPNNQKRFVRATDRILKQVEGYLADVYTIGGSIPAGAENHYAKLKNKLEERQRYYARLKDAVDQKNEQRWKEAFANYDQMQYACLDEEQALNDLQTAVLKKPNAP
jgi:hypothetical protein